MSLRISGSKNPPTYLFSVRKIGIIFITTLIMILCCSQIQAAQETEDSTIVVYADNPGETINKGIYGHFAEHLGGCIYGGFWVGPDSSIPNTRGIRNDVVEALKKLDIPVLRWPGGCFADEYHWKDGIGPRDERPGMVNTHWGMVTEENAFGTHEFLDLCEQLECEAYIAGNVGSGTPEEMQDWVEYMTFAGDSEMANLRRKNGRDEPWDVKYFGIGNENWGCGGNMTAEYYADLYRRFQTYVRDYPGNDLEKVACGPGGENYHWMETLMREAGRRMDAISMHYYVRGTGNWRNKGSATEFDEKDWFALMKNTLSVDDVIERYKEIMNRYDRRRRTGLYVDEWGTWWDAKPGTNPAFLYQQNTLRDAVSAGIFLNLFNQHCDRVKMANIAQTVNVLQAMVLTKDEQMILTPTYHVFEMYKVHQDAQLLPTDLECDEYEFDNDGIDALNVSASRNSDGAVNITICNLDPHTSSQLSCEFEGLEPSSAEGRVLTTEKMNIHNTFENPDAIEPVQLENLKIEGNTVEATLPAKSITVLTVK